MNGEREANPRIGAATFALAHGCGEGFQDFAVEFVEGHFDGANGVALFTTPGDESDSECASASACIQQPNHSRKRTEH